MQVLIDVKLSPSVQLEQLLVKILAHVKQGAVHANNI